MRSIIDNIVFWSGFRHSVQDLGLCGFRLTQLVILLHATNGSRLSDSVLLYFDYFPLKGKGENRLINVSFHQCN